MGERARQAVRGRVEQQTECWPPTLCSLALLCAPGPPHLPESPNLQLLCLPIGGLESHTSWDAAQQLSLTLPTKQPSPKPILPGQQLNLRLNKRGA